MNISKITIKLDIKLSLWSAIKMRIAGINNIIRSEKMGEYEICHQFSKNIEDKQ